MFNYFFFYCLELQQILAAVQHSQYYAEQASPATKCCSAGSIRRNVPSRWRCLQRSGHIPDRGASAGGHHA